MGENVDHRQKRQTGPNFLQFAKTTGNAGMPVSQDASTFRTHRRIHELASPRRWLTPQTSTGCSE